MKTAPTPDMFTKPRTALTSPHPAPIIIPKIAQDGTPDYEGELCVVIGKDARDVPADKAAGHILGYTVANDVSARTLQFLASQWSLGKGMDGFCPIGESTNHSTMTDEVMVGPVLVSPSAIPDPQDLHLQTTYNGQVMQEGDTKNMILCVFETIA
jgi:2-keto-4-pentenoate hydratase/2-oxohepta-3-ene-1,7-dioic acid hydratase in catechol pathway